MNDTASITRRDFIKVASATGAGLVIGFYLPTLDRFSAYAAPPPASFEPNAWLSIDSAGIVTVNVGKSEMGQGVYTSLPMILAEELEADWGSIRVQHPAADTAHGHMGTGGSSSVRTAWDPLRKAGATAREMLISAAAETWKVPRTECYAEQGFVVHRPSGQKLGYGDLSAKASSITPPENPPLKDPKDYRIVGKPRKRLDTPEKVDGSGLFGIDVKTPGMLFAAIARCPVFGGKADHFDATKAKAVPGVRQVVQIDRGVAVVAESSWAAFQGRDALNVTWNEGPDAAMSSAKILAMLQDAAKKPGASARKEGNPAGALARAKKKVQALYEAPFLAHATMEPMNATADVRPDRCEIWTATQDPQWAKGEAARLTGLPGEKVTVHTMLLGGGFGRRSWPDPVIEAVQTSKAIGAPVKVVWTREDDMQHDYYRPVSHHHLQAGLDAKGNLIAWTNHTIAPSIADQMNPGSLKNGVDHGALHGAEDIAYDIPNLEVTYSVITTPVPLGWWRSVYASQNAYADECFLDEVAAAAGKDPYQFRHALLGKDKRLRGVLDLAAEKAKWKRSLPEGHHHGIACLFSFGSYVAEVAEVSLKGKEIRVHKVVAAVDCGIAVNPATIEAQIESAIVYGLTAALKGQVTIERGRVVQGNFDDYPLLTIDEMPAIEVYIVPSKEALGGIGEPGLPPIAPAVVNAMFAATKNPVRKLPIHPV